MDEDEVEQAVVRSISSSVAATADAARTAQKLYEVFFQFGFPEGELLLRVILRFKAVVDAVDEGFEFGVTGRTEDGHFGGDGDFCAIPTDLSVSSMDQREVALELTEETQPSRGGYANAKVPQSWLVQ